MLFVQLEKQQWYSILKNVALLKDHDFIISTKFISEHVRVWYTQKVATASIANTMLYALFHFKKCCTAKGQRFCYFNEIHFRTCSWLIYSESRKSRYCKYYATFSTSLVNCGVGKNRQKPGKLVIERTSLLLS